MQTGRNAFFIFFTILFSCQGMFSSVPNGPSVVYLEGNRLIVEKRSSNNSLENPMVFGIKGVSWAPATKAPFSGPNPKNAKEEIEYGFFFDWKGRDVSGYQLLTEWLKAEQLKYYEGDARILEALNVNAIRLYGHVADNKRDCYKILDEFYNSNIMVIICPAMTKAEVDDKSYLKQVRMCKDHPAVLMWCLGNEWNLGNGPYFGYKSIKKASASIERIAAEIKKIDPNHPVSSCIGDRFFDNQFSNSNAGIVKSCPSIDIWGLNIYRGESFGGLFEQWKETSDKPFYISEFGTDSFKSMTFESYNGDVAKDCVGTEDQDMQADFDMKLLTEIIDHLSSLKPEQQCVGGFVFTFNDTLWKVGCFHIGLGGILDYNSDEERFNFSRYDTDGFFMPGSHPDNVANEEYFGIVDANRVPKKVYFELQKYFRSIH